MIKYIFWLAATLSAVAPLWAQDDSEVLFTVGDEPVTVGEFRYIYAKTNGDEADFSKESVMEYLDLYERFKLKVARARDMGLDTVAALQNELEGYRQQLADNYLIDRQVTDKLVERLYERKKLDVDFSHILLKLPAGRNVDTSLLYRRASELKSNLTPANFAEQAALVSEDQYSKEKGGRIGFVTAPFPKGLHNLEAALYDAPKGVVSGPVRTAAGYHLFIKHDTRPARGEMEVAHILIRKGADAGAGEERKKAEAARAALEAGKSFEAVAAEFSEDNDTKNQGGYIGFFGINRYNPVFEDAAFALETDGEISKVIESPVGFHILRRISRRGVQPLSEQRPLLENAVKNDERFAEAQSAMLERIEQNAGVKEMKRNFGMYTATLDSTFFEPGFKAEPIEGDPVLVTIGDQDLHISDFQDYLQRNARFRAGLQRSRNASGAAETLYDSWLEEQVMAYAESRLEEDFPEFRSLMREYREGILLFEATKIEVWDKAAEDTVGLQDYFSKNRDSYQFGRRGEVVQYTVNNKGDVNINEVLAYAESHNADAVQDKFGRKNVSAKTDFYEEDRLPEGVSMEVGSQSAVTNDLRSGTSTFYQVESIDRARQKELREARGYVIADYQDQLEKEWVAELRKDYQVKVNKKVLSKLIKS